jgi:hypothetical protein
MRREERDRSADSKESSDICKHLVGLGGLLVGMELCRQLRSGREWKEMVPSSPHDKENTNSLPIVRTNSSHLQASISSIVYNINFCRPLEQRIFIALGSARLDPSRGNSFVSQPAVAAMFSHALDSDLAEITLGIGAGMAIL